MEEKSNVLEILNATKSAIVKKDVVLIKKLSDRTIHTAAITQDPDNIAIAVIVYALSKLIEREKYHKMPGWSRFFRTYMSCIDKAISALKKDDMPEFTQQIKKIRKAINKLSGRLRDYIADVFRKASINKASRIYEHGISMEKTAKLLGITLWELAEYAGQKIHDAELSITLEPRERIEMAEEFFTG